MIAGVLRSKFSVLCTARNAKGPFIPVKEFPIASRTPNPDVTDSGDGFGAAATRGVVMPTESRSEGETGKICHGNEPAKVQRSVEKVRLNRWVLLAVFALLSFYAVMAWTASLSKGLSFDEGVQLASGYNIWLHDDFRLEGANGDLIKRWATLPYLISRPNFLSTDDPRWRQTDSYELGRLFLFHLGNQPEVLLAHARAMAALLGVATGGLVFLAARELFGALGGLFATTIFAFSPHMLAFGGVVSTDMSITLTLLGSTWCIWRLLHEVTWRRVAGSLVCCGLLVLAKMTALVIFPITALLLAVRFVGGKPLILRWGGRVWSIESRRGQAGVFAGLVLLHAIASWGSIWAHYGFRFQATPPTSGLNPVLDEVPRFDGVPPRVNAVVKTARDTRFLPEGFCRGVEWLLGTDDELPAFMAGRTKFGGWRTFFPYAIWVKTQPTLFLLLVFAAVAWWSARRRANNKADARDTVGATPGLYQATPYLALVGVYLAVAMTEDLNLGHRHVLPIYPALHVLAGAAALVWRRHARVE